MGATFSVVFEADVPLHGTLGGDNPTLHRAQRKLDRIALDVGLRSLDEFESYDPPDIAAALDLEIDPDDPKLTPVEWFPAADGLAAVRALIAHLRSHPDAVRSQADVLNELASVEAELSDADRAGVRFHFQVVP